MSITWRRFPEMERTCPVVLFMSGASSLPSTGLMRFFFGPVNALIATILAFAEPCLPGLDFSNSTILHGSPSMRTYWPIFKLPTSTGLLMKLRPAGQPSKTSSKSLMPMLRFGMVLGEFGLVSNNFHGRADPLARTFGLCRAPKQMWRIAGVVEFYQDLARPEPYFNAWRRSSIRSSGCSIPTDRRSRLGCAVEYSPSLDARCSMRLSVPPRLVAFRKSLTFDATIVA